MLQSNQKYSDTAPDNWKFTEGEFYIDTDKSDASNWKHFRFILKPTHYPFEEPQFASLSVAHSSRDKNQC